MSAKKLNLEFVYIDAGGGHRNAAVALGEVIAARFPHWHITFTNLFQDVLRSIDPVHRFTRIRRSEDIYNSVLRSGHTYGFSTILRVMHRMIKWHAASIENMLRQHWEAKPHPDLVVSLIPHFNRVMQRSLHDVYPGVPFVTVMTDLADTPPHFWQETWDQFIICGSDRALAQATSAGYRRENIFKASGMILKSNFYEDYSKFDRRKERTKLGLDPDAATALIMFGGHGAGTAEKIVTRLAHLYSPVQSIVMCGHNEKLHKKLLGKKFCHPVAFTTSEVPYYMYLADFFIGKPGPGSISEALHMGLPVIVERNSRTMPQERYNTAWIEDQNLGIVIKNFGKIGAAVKYLLEQGRLESFRHNADMLKNTAVYEIPGILEQIMAGRQDERKRA